MIHHKQIPIGSAVPTGSQWFLAGSQLVVSGSQFPVGSQCCSQLAVPVVPSRFTKVVPGHFHRFPAVFSRFLAGSQQFLASCQLVLSGCQ